MPAGLPEADRGDADIRGPGYSPSGRAMLSDPTTWTHGSDGVTLDYGRFEAVTFDCYGTLIDWEAGLADAFAPILRDHGVEVEDEEVLVRYAGHEAAAEAGPYLRYRDVLATGLRGVAADLGFEPTPAEVEGFSGSVVAWPAFPDSAAALALLQGRFRLGVITNCDDDLFAASNARLGVEFDPIVTAQQVGSYKPAEANFHAAFDRLALPRERILHVAQSLFHDHVPARRLGLSTVWIDRRHDRPGAGATPAVEGAVPDATFPDMASFAAAATARSD
jgi:2-haloacid dehalogenase